MRRYGCGPEDCYEYALVKAQISGHVGMFLCDEHAVFSQDKEMSLGRIGGNGPEVITNWFPKAKVGHSDDGFAANTLLFIHVWEAVRKDGTWARHDWITKSDPDAVIIPWRIRRHVGRITGLKNYVPNCNAFPHSSLYPMIYGSFEAFSKRGLRAYFHGGASKCVHALPWQPWGEDKFMGECMKHLGVQQATDVSILNDKRCGGTGTCTDGTAAAYHDFKTMRAWFHCWHEAVGG